MNVYYYRGILKFSLGNLSLIYAFVFFFLKGAIEVNIIYLLILLVHDFNSIQWYAVWQFDSVVFLKLQFVLCTEPGGREA